MGRSIANPAIVALLLLTSCLPSRLSEPTSLDILLSQFTGSSDGDPITELNTPVLSLASGSYTYEPSISITANAGATVCYTSNGIAPDCVNGVCTTGSTYSGPFTLASSATDYSVRAIACMNGLSNSPEASADYAIDASPPSTPGSLAAVTVTENSISIEWVASSDNRTAAASLRYEICIATTAATCSAFTTGTTNMTGSTDIALTGLNTMTLYYIAIRAFDDFGNGSAVSTQLTIQTKNVFTGPTEFVGGDGYVTVDSSGLWWTSCVAGVSGADCSVGSPMAMDFAGAQAYCDGLAVANWNGRNSWHLPMITELIRLVDCTNGPHPLPAMDGAMCDPGFSSPVTYTTAFPNAPSDYVWTSTPNGADYWSLKFGSGLIEADTPATDPLLVRCLAD